MQSGYNFGNAHSARKEGGATMKNMSYVYWNMKLKDCKRLRSQKVSAVLRLERKHLGYFDQQELRKLRQQVIWLDAVIAAKAAQLALPE